MKLFLKNYWVLITILLITICCLVRYLNTMHTNELESQPQIKEIKIGAILPLSGPVASFGKWAQNGMNIAIEDNTSNTKIVVFFEDSKFEGKTGLLAYQKLVATNNVDVIISAMSNVSIPILGDKSRNVPVFLQDVTYPNITEKYHNVLRHFIQSDREATVLSKFAIDSLKLKTSGIIYVNDEAGNGAKDAFKELFSKKGKVLIEESFENRTKDVKTQVTKIINAKPECVFLFGNGPTWALTLKTLKELNYKGIILTNTALYIPVFRNIAGESTEGVYFTYPYIDENNLSSKKFIDLYQSKYNEFPPLEAAYGYDLIKIISKTHFENNTFKLPDNFSGAFGNLKIPQDKDIVTKIALAKYSNNSINNLEIK